jgi:4-hydroxy-tetrahydrodipicolinate reductase
MIRIAVHGAKGRMGQAMVSGLKDRSEISVVGEVDAFADGSDHVLTSIDQLDATSIDAVVDFSSPVGALACAQWCSANGVAMVSGTTGLRPDQLLELRGYAEQTAIVHATNFSIGAVLSERFAAQAAPYFDRVEIVELHHDKKLDAPSGTSITTASMIAGAREAAGLAPLTDGTDRHTVEGARGAQASGGVRIHSVRLPGLVAHQEVLFGGPGEGLTIRHDSFDRQSFVHGVALALAHVGQTPGFVEGIASFL